MNIITRFYAFLMLRSAVRVADRMHNQNHKRYYVCPNSDKKVRLIVTDRKNFRALRMKGYIDSSYKMNDAFTMCFYCTAHPNGDGALTQAEALAKRIRFFEWYASRLPYVRRARRRSHRNRLMAFFRNIKGIFNRG